VYSHTTVRRPASEAFEAPYVVAVVQLEEGWHLFTNVVGCEPADVSTDMPVRVRFVPLDDVITLPCFEPRVLGRCSTFPPPGLGSSS
jgi:uncharacterized OB-fold protein